MVVRDMEEVWVVEVMVVDDQDPNLHMFRVIFKKCYLSVRLVKEYCRRFLDNNTVFDHF